MAIVDGKNLHRRWRVDLPGAVGSTLVPVDMVLRSNSVVKQCSRRGLLALARI